MKALPQETRQSKKETGVGALATQPTYKETARNVFAATGEPTQRAETPLAKRVGAANALARARQEPDTLSGVFMRATPGMAAALPLGVLDGSQIGTQFYEGTGKLLKPSTAVAVLAGLFKATSMDRKIGRSASKMTNAVLAAKLPILVYDIGTRLPGIWSARTESAATAAAPAQLAGAATSSQKEPIPGEMTYS